MSDTDGILALLGVYTTQEAAEADFDQVKKMHQDKFIGAYEAALFSKEEGGKVKIHNTDAIERSYGAQVGVVTGAVIGILFPPSILAAGAVGAGLGAAMGNLFKGMKRRDIKELGDVLDEGDFGIIVLAQPAPGADLSGLMQRAAKVEQRMIDTTPEDLQRNIEKAEGA